ncbi:hypothetical protein QZH41_017316, partial [Actinostola sp. cb2023]
MKEPRDEGDEACVGKAQTFARKKRYYNEHLANPNLKVPRATHCWNRRQQLAEVDRDCADYVSVNDVHESFESIPSKDSIEAPLFSFPEEDDIFVDDEVGVTGENFNTNEETNELLYNYQVYDHFADDDLLDDDDEWKETVELDEPLEDGEIPNIENRPLYEGAPISLAVSMLLVITFAVRHSLTGVALADLLLLMQTHFISPNFFRHSTNTLRQFFTLLKNPLQFHYYCSFCYEYVGLNKTKNCTNKHCLKDFSKKGSLAYFIVVPLITQLESLYKRKGIPDLLKYPARRVKKNSKNIEDIYDGKLYKTHFDKDGYFKGTKNSRKKHEVHLSLQINTDGVALFRSSKFSVWPVYYIVNEFPPNHRFQRQNRVFAGLWFGMRKPLFQTFMQPFAESLKDIFHKGTVVISYIGFLFLLIYRFNTIVLT